jgi:hypothetical protein
MTQTALAYVCGTLILVAGLTPPAISLYEALIRC